MQRFFFHIEFGEYNEDREGTEYPNLDDASGDAVALLGELLRDQAGKFWAKPAISVTVTDGNGLSLWKIETVGVASAAVQSGR